MEPPLRTIASLITLAFLISSVPLHAAQSSWQQQQWQYQQQQRDWQQQQDRMRQQQEAAERARQAQDRAARAREQDRINRQHGRDQQIRTQRERDSARQAREAQQGADQARRIQQQKAVEQQRINTRQKRLRQEKFHRRQIAEKKKREAEERDRDTAVMATLSRSGAVSLSPDLTTRLENITRSSATEKKPQSNVGTRDQRGASGPTRGTGTGGSGPREPSSLSRTFNVKALKQGGADAKPVSLSQGLQARLNGLTDTDAANARKQIDSRIHLVNYGHSVHANIKGDERAKVIAEGHGRDVHVTSLYRGNLPEGSGGILLARTLKGHNMIPKDKLVFPNILNDPTQEAFRRGVKPEDTVLGKTALNAFKELGLKPGPMRIYEKNEKLILELDVAK